MSEENKENRINVDDLPQAEQELTPEEAKDVQGGGFTGGVSIAVADVSGDNTSAGGHVKVIDGTRLP